MGGVDGLTPSRVPTTATKNLTRLLLHLQDGGDNSLLPPFTSPWAGHQPTPPRHAAGVLERAFCLRGCRHAGTLPRRHGPWLVPLPEHPSLLRAGPPSQRHKQTCQFQSGACYLGSRDPPTHPLCTRYEITADPRSLTSADDGFERSTAGRCAMVGQS